MHTPKPNPVAKSAYEPTPVTIVTTTSPDREVHRVLVRGHMSTRSQQRYVEGLELAPNGAAVTFELHDLYADLSEFRSVNDWMLTADRWKRVR